MIRHIVLFTLRPDVPPDDPRIGEAMQRSAGLRSLPQARSWMVESNISDRDIAADAVAIGDFDDMDQLGEFLRHPEHVAAGSVWSPLATWTIADIRLPAGA